MSVTAAQIAEASRAVEAAKIETRAIERKYNEALSAQILLQHKLDELIFDKTMEKWVEQEARKKS